MTDPGRARCPSCAAELPSAFPGACVACTCGTHVALPPRHGAAPSSLPGEERASAFPGAESAGPYRSAASVPTEAFTVMVCPYCGNDCPALVRICPHCDVRLDNVRCQRCFSLQAPGSFACARCGCPLELEPLFDATDAPCPRCNHALEVSPGEDVRLHECPRCGGMFVPRAILAEVLCSAELAGVHGGRPPRSTWNSRAARDAERMRPLDVTAVPPLEQVRYLRCPLCHASMNRVNFGRVSGVLVDVCRMHGTWFDAGELTRVVVFAASGKLEETRAREAAENHASAIATELPPVTADEHLRARLDVWLDFLRLIFG